MSFGIFLLICGLPLAWIGLYWLVLWVEDFLMSWPFEQ